MGAEPSRPPLDDRAAFRLFGLALGIPLALLGALLAAAGAGWLGGRLSAPPGYVVGIGLFLLLLGAIFLAVGILSRFGTGTEPAAAVPSQDFRDAPWQVKAIVLAIALGAIGMGGDFLAEAFGYGIGYMAKSDLPRWIGFAAGLIFFLPGVAMAGLFLYGVGVPLGGAARILGLLFVLVAAGSLLAIFHWGAFFGDPESWRGTRIGSIAPRDIARIIAVWFDLLVLQFIALVVWLGLSRSRAVTGKALPWPRWSISAFIFAPAAVAGALHLSGAFDWIEMSGPRMIPLLARTAPAAAPKPAPPARPLEHYLGTWVNPKKDRNSSHRLEVRTDGASVYIRAWQTCLPKDCDRGEARAEVVRVNPGADQIIELRAELRSSSGEALTIALVPEGEVLRARESTRAGGKVVLGDAKLRRHSPPARGTR